MIAIFFQANVNRYFYSKVTGERDWSFFVRYDPRGRPDEEYREDEPGIGYNAILDDDVEEDMLENDIDDDDDIINPFNIVSKLDDYTNV